MTDSVEGLIRDFTSRLSTIAAEFGARADGLAGRRPANDTDDGRDPDERRVAAARRMLDERRRRSRFLPADLFHEPAWDMLLTLFVARRERAAFNVKALVRSAEAPATTSQRWIEHMAQLGLVERVTDPADRRRIEVALSDRGHDLLCRYLDDLAQG